MPLLRNIGLLATCRAEGGQAAIHPIAHAALAWEGSTIRWVGAEADLPRDYHSHPTHDAGGRLVIPGLVDCHTHLAFGGWRADEFEQKLAGRSYLEIAKAGGGIARTVQQTRSLDTDALRARCLGFLQQMLRLGVTTVECKSGYGLDPDHEIRLLEVYHDLRDETRVNLVPTFLGAHTIPPGYRDRREDYVALVIETMIPRVAAGRLAEYCDVFVEDSAFTREEARRILLAAKAAGMGLKLHADQLTSGGGAELAAELGAASADHLERISAAGIRALAAAGTVAVSLPLATLYLNHSPLPARALIEAGAPVAVATDFNPGSAPSYHLPLALTLACTLQRMTPAEALKGATIIAARAIGRDHLVGSLEPGKRADFVVVDSPDVSHWLYHFRANAAVMVVADGVGVWGEIE